MAVNAKGHGRRLPGCAIFLREPSFVWHSAGFLVKTSEHCRSITAKGLITTCILVSWLDAADAGTFSQQQRMRSLNLLSTPGPSAFDNGRL